ncbi:AMP-binding enzyme [Seminavis robusta]|uniref:AMP-binding enzyme n=1 Tax=Seminavis robusta TaxID=568900 RepID=A0A9N8H9J9_9STRA|nr:AMP-binding enzyme [Seminavis robusta]|eukprot:Sro194_g082950.1 AMP-binding enzyme (286) ;mRNA; r:68343-69334
MRAALLKNLRSAASRVGRTSMASRPLVASTAMRSFATATAGGNLSVMTKENPHVDVVRYEHKNRKWSLGHVDYYSEALAIGFVESGLKPGDAVLCYLPLHFSETMVLQFACSKAGFVFYHLDPALAETDPAKSKTALEQALTLSKANVLVTQEATDDVNYISLVEEIIPDIDVFDFASGMPFVCPQFPHLRFPVHTGFDQEQKWGFIPLRHMLVPSDNLDEQLKGFELSGSTPLLGQFTLGSDGVPTSLGQTLTNDQVLQDNAWPTFAAILKKEFHDVEGVGVVW